MWFTKAHTFALFALLGALLTEATEYTSNYRTITLALATAGINPQQGVQYAIMEKWAAHNAIEQCCVGFSHVRLVVGSLVFTPGRQTRQQQIEDKWDFRATAWELTKDASESIASAVYGAPVAYNEDRAWVAHGFYRNRVFMSHPNEYVALGVVRNGITATFIRNLGR